MGFPAPLQPRLQAQEKVQTHSQVWRQRDGHLIPQQADLSPQEQLCALQPLRATALPLPEVLQRQH